MPPFAAGRRYTTTCGTEGNLLSILYGRECFPDGVLYCSKDTHYSVPKASEPPATEPIPASLPPASCQPQHK